jgi:phosphonate transport system substrate-binding protein
MQSPQGTFASYADLVQRLGSTLGVEVELVQRRTYGEVNDLLAAGKVDAAILCTGGYLQLEREHPGSVELVAVPTIHGESTYRSYLIVPSDSRARTLADLEGRAFAFTDELSLSGKLWVEDQVRRSGHDPAAYFGGVQLTGSHDRSIEAVAGRVVDGASVDSLVFDQLAAARPALAAAIRIIERSPPFGAAPVVASTRLPPPRRAQLRDALLSLAADPAAAPGLRAIGVDGFVLPPPHLFDSAAAVVGTHR